MAALVLGMVTLGGAAAQAHVTVQPGTAQQGGYGALSFRAPTEKDDASTVKVVVQFPLDTPLASVSVKPHPGWSYSVTKAALATPVTAHGQSITEAVQQVEWTADRPEAGVKPGEFDEFTVSAGPFPETDQMVFKVLQYYSDGDVVRWIQEPAEGASLDRPAPVLKLTPKATGNAAASNAGGSDAAGSASGSGIATWLSGAALLVSLATAGWVAVGPRRRSMAPQVAPAPTAGEPAPSRTP
ncbi:MAG: YcnI family copper-binding membrane protein [Intrasporangium sp.]|uniref:YcnI family copper-binding membrane protein n=1 Tax=Intrasporangium sp. TaxID=1925024 RepID=UPI003F81A727